MAQPPIRGRGAAENPRNRYETIDIVRDAWTGADDPAPRTQFLRDTSRSAITYNDSPDVGFQASINPYRGCEHGCIYCYARLSHEYLGFSPGLDFETRIMVKEDAPELLRRELLSPRWKPQPLALSGITDAYQPVERRLRLTRRCLEALVEFRNPVMVVTKNELVTRDIDLLSALAAHRAASVTISLTTLDPEIHRALEPRTPTPARRVETVRALAAARIPVSVLMAPVIPGLTDHEIPRVVQAAADAGALEADFSVLRLPGAVASLFDSWLERHFPERKAKVLNRVRELRGGRLNDARFGKRMSGEGRWADQLRYLHRIARRKAGMPGMPELSVAAFRRPGRAEELELFGEP